MLPANRAEHVVTVHRSLDVSEEDLIDVVTAFAVDQDLELDRRHEGEGLLFRREGRTTGAGHLFAAGDALHVIITDAPGGYDVEMIADVRDTLKRKAESRRGHVVRSGLVGALFAYLGVRGLVVDVSFGDFVLLGISTMFGRRALRYSRRELQDYDELERHIANELNAVLDRAQR